jgi:hypothetical protein
MAGVFQNIDTPPPHRPASVYPLAFDAGDGHTRWVERRWGVNILEDAGHYSVLYIFKYFVYLRIKHFLPNSHLINVLCALSEYDNTNWYKTISFLYFSSSDSPSPSV